MKRTRTNTHKIIYFREIIITRYIHKHSYITKMHNNEHIHYILYTCNSDGTLAECSQWTHRNDDFISSSTNLKYYDIIQIKNVFENIHHESTHIGISLIYQTSLQCDNEN